MFFASDWFGGRHCVSRSPRTLRSSFLCYAFTHHTIKGKTRVKKFVLFFFFFFSSSGECGGGHRALHRDFVKSSRPSRRCRRAASRGIDRPGRPVARHRSTKHGLGVWRTSVVFRDSTRARSPRVFVVCKQIRGGVGGRLTHLTSFTKHSTRGRRVAQHGAVSARRRTKFFGFC